MPDWVLWVIAAAFLAAGEAATAALVLGPLALAAAVAAIVGAAGAGFGAQVLAFVLVSIASLGILRPIAKRHLRQPAHMRTGTAALIGCSATVLQQVDGDRGQVKTGREIRSS